MELALTLIPIAPMIVPAAAMIVIRVMTSGAPGAGPKRARASDQIIPLT